MIKTELGTLPEDWQRIHIFRNIAPPKDYENYVNLMAKQNEETYIYDGFVYKHFYDSRRCLARVCRTLELDGITPPIFEWDNNWYKYKYMVGCILTHDLDNLLSYLNWMQENCWQYYEPDKICWDVTFYIDKTLNRIKKYEDSFVNNWVRTQTFSDVRLSRMWHGDCSFENIVCVDDGFILLDWRENPFGDVYYDIAKLIKSVYFNHETLNEHGIWMGHDPEYEHLILQWAGSHGYDTKEIEKIVAIAVLAMSGSHSGNFGKGLFQWGKTLIQKMT